CAAAAAPLHVSVRGDVHEQAYGPTSAAGLRGGLASHAREGTMDGLRRDASGARDQVHLPDTRVLSPSPTVVYWLCQAASFRAEYGLLVHLAPARTPSSH